MSKSLTLSMSLAIALGFSGVSFAGHGGCATCGLASPQGVVASPQASSQSVAYETCDTCAPAKKHGFKFSWPSCLKPKPKVYTYEWVLKKKKVHGHAAETCDTCAAPAVTPSAQWASPQGTYAAPQAHAAAQTASVYPTSEMRAAEPAPAPDAVPPAPTAPAPAPPAAPVPPVPNTSTSSLLFLSPAGN